MPTGLGFGLLAALVWGITDVSGAVTGRRLGSMRAVVGTQVASLIGLAVFTALRPDLLGPTALAGIAIGLPLGLLSSVAYILYFTALRIGPLSVVSPVIVSYGGITVILAILVRGETMLPAQVGGALLATAGVILTGLVFHGGTLRGARLVGPGVIAAVITAFVFAAVSVLLATPIRDHGWLAVIAGSRIANTTASICLLVLAERTKAPRFRPLLIPGGALSRRLAALMFVAGLCDIGGFLVYGAGLGIGPVWLVGLASSFGPVLAVVYGVGWLEERLRPTQWLGIAVLAVGIAVLAVAG